MNVLIRIQYCRWGGNPKDNWAWEGIVMKEGDGMRVGDGWDYDLKEHLIQKCLNKGYDYEVVRYKRNGQIQVVETNQI